jgi:hypothetical protein
MHRSPVALGLLVLSSCVTALPAQMKHTSVPLGNTLNKALNHQTLTGPDARPFHIRVVIAEPENPQSPYQGTIEEWWGSPQQWRREITAKSGLRQTIVVASAAKTEEDIGDYFPHWLRTFETAAFDPVPDHDAWTASGAQIEQTIFPNGMQSPPCARIVTKIGTGDRAGNAYSNVCFDAQGRLNFIGSPGYSMEFHDYAGFEKKQFPRKFIDNPESGTTLVGTVVTLEKLSANSETFKPLAHNDDRFQSGHLDPAQLEALTASQPAINWPLVRSGNLRGHVTVYLSADSTGQVREVWPLAGDNGEIHDFTREQVAKWKLPPSIGKDGQPTQIDGPITFAFETKIGVPLPELSDAETRALAIQIVDPDFSSPQFHKGDAFFVQISVDEHGKVAGTDFRSTSPATAMTIMKATRDWTFHPLIRDGKPQYFHGNLKFVVP